MIQIHNADWNEMNAWALESPEYKAIQETGHKYQNETHWKNPVARKIKDQAEAQKFVHWINAFHGCKAGIDIVRMVVRHPEGLIDFEIDGYLISSKGYSC